MKTKREINNIQELRAEISRLKVLKYEQESYLGDQFQLLEHKLEAPARLYNRLTSWMPNSLEGILPSISSPNQSTGSDWITNSLRIGLPFLFNKILFRKAGFIKKALLLVASQQAAGFFNKDKLAGIIDSISSIIHPSPNKKKKKKETDYGIPPDSETY